MTINLIVIGKLKEGYLRSACAEYIKRLARYCTFELHELDECRLGDSPSEKEIASALAKEAEQIKRFAKEISLRAPNFPGRSPLPELTGSAR